MKFHFDHLNDHLVFDQNDSIGDERDKNRDDAAKCPHLKVGHSCNHYFFFIPCNKLPKKVLPRHFKMYDFLLTSIIRVGRVVHNS